MIEDIEHVLASIDEALRHKTAEKAYVRQQLRNIKQEIKQLRRQRRSVEGSV